jgi:hypothetical protein
VASFSLIHSFLDKMAGTNLVAAVTRVETPHISGVLETAKPKSVAGHERMRMRSCWREESTPLGHNGQEAAVLAAL